MTSDADAATTGRPLPLLRAAHAGPALAVTVLALLLAIALGLTGAEVALATGAVLTGQLTIGWGNDLVDAERDRTVRRTDKPLAAGEVTRGLVLGCLFAALVACVALSALAGWRMLLVNLLLHVAGGHAYNLFFKHTVWSWLPYAVAFGALPAVVTLTAGPPGWPPSWMVGVAATLGVAAHFLNVLPDLDDDAATGVHGLPHRLGARAARVAATALLLVASAVAVLGPAGPPEAWTWVALGVVGVLALVALLGRGRAPFRAAIGIALVDVLLLVLAGR